MTRCLTIPSLLLVSGLSAQTLDPSFGTGGIAVHDYGQAATIFDAVLQPDGKVLVTGRLEEAGSLDDEYLLARFNADGSIDSGFGNGGYITTVGTDSLERGMSLALLPDGRILMLAVRAPQIGVAHSVIRRYLPNGTLDTVFGINGQWESDLAPREQPGHLRLLADGRMLVGGSRSMTLPAYRPFVYRVLAGGTTDTSFGTNGASEVPSAFNQNYYMDTQILDDGMIIVSGNFNLDDGFMARFTADGALDNGFDGDGILLFDLSSEVEEVTHVRQLPDGTALAAVGRYGAVGEIWLYRVAADGTFLPYGGAIGVNVDLGPDAYANDLAFDSQGNLLLFVRNSAPVFVSKLARLANGILDVSFGTGGIVLQPITEWPSGRRVLVRPDGRLLLVGYGNTTDFQEYDHWMVQYTNVPVGVPEQANQAALRIAPNPVDHAFTLTGATPFDPRARVVVHDALGREMNAPFTLQQGRIEVGAAALTPGAYTITLFSSAGTLTRRFAKH